MGLGDLIKRLFAAPAAGASRAARSSAGQAGGAGARQAGRAGADGTRTKTGAAVGPAIELGMDELSRRLQVSLRELQAAPVNYVTYTIPKRSGGMRTIAAPEPPLKNLQRRILFRLLSRLRCHDAAMGFIRGRSVVTNARGHVGKAVVVRMDLKDYFTSTQARRIAAYFRRIGWCEEAAAVLTRICTLAEGLPQGAPTSPMLSNLVNYRMDARLAGLAGRFGAAYTRYADDLTFSLSTDEPDAIHAIIRHTKLIVADEGYRLHQRKKLHIRRRHECQTVTGIVVNERPNLSRRRRRWLRAVQHRMANGGKATLTPAQLAGWQSLQEMIQRQAQ